MVETNQPNLKAGVKTSEFWITIVTSVVGIMVATGHLTPVQADDFVQAVIAVVGGATTIAATLAYLYGRFKLKQESLQNSSQIEGVPDSLLESTSSDVPPVYPQ